MTCGFKVRPSHTQGSVLLASNDDVECLSGFVLVGELPWQFYGWVGDRDESILRGTSLGGRSISGAHTN